MESSNKPSPSAVTTRRQFERVAADRCVIDYRPIADESALAALKTQGKALVQNISGGGVCITMSEDPGLGKMLALNLCLPGLPTSVLALGKVVWIETPTAGSYDVGIEFWWVGWQDPGAQEDIRQFISSKLERRDG